MRKNKFINFVLIASFMFMPIHQAQAFWWKLLKYSAVGTAGVAVGTAIANAENRDKSACDWYSNGRDFKNQIARNTRKHCPETN